MSNKPGGLAYFAGLISESGANIIRTVNTTTSTGDFHVRMVLTGLNEEQKPKLFDIFSKSRFALDSIEIS